MIYNAFDFHIGAQAMAFVVGLALEIDTHNLWELTPNELNLEQVSHKQSTVACNCVLTCSRLRYTEAVYRCLCFPGPFLTGWL